MHDIKTKTIATIGPASNTVSIISNLIKSGMDVARINMSHFKTKADFESIVSIIRIEADKQNKHIGILVDLAGPKVRIDLNGDTSINIVKNHIYSLGFNSKNDITINVDINFKNIHLDDSYVKIDDGKIVFKVLEKKDNSLIIKALDDGLALNRKGVNFPGVELELDSLTDIDKQHLLLATQNDIDWLALSFVRKSEDITPVLDIYKKKDIYIPVIAKIEKPEAVENLDSIIQSFDGILIARGDLGVEMSLAKLPGLQKMIIEKCRNAKKPVIVATQMLDSMIENSTPTRAEVNDVANAVYEGVDAVMLSGETAMGKYPTEAMAIMQEILLSAEEEVEKDSTYNEISIEVNNDNRSAIGESVKLISKHLNIDAIVVMTESGSTAIIVSHYRPRNNIFALTPSKAICNKLSLVWGVIPLLTKSFNSTDQMIIESEKILVEKELLKFGDTFVLTAGAPVGVSGTTNMLKIHKIMIKD
jgi:pyruvate kinase